MNQLSVMLYLADMIPNIGVLVCTLGVIFCVGAVISTILSIVLGSDHYSEERRKYWDGVRQRWNYAMRLLWPLAIVLLLLAVAIPSRSTMMMITASQAGEVIAKTPEAQELVRDSLSIIRGWLKAQVKEK